MKRYQVFISSTYTDLIEERSAVVECILKLRHIPVGMEHFVAANEEQFSFIKRLIDETDYYILVIGNRYGSTADDGISYTEKEFDYAVSKGIPVLAFVHSAPDTLPVNKSEITALGRKKLSKFREKVLTNRLVSMFPWENPASLSREVVVALTNAFNDCPRPGWNRFSSPLLQKEGCSDATVVNQKLIRILNYTLGEAYNSKLNKRPFSIHKTNPEALETKLNCGDSIEVMTNTLSYDLNEESLSLVAGSLANSVQYYYYLENNAATTNSLGKFINGVVLEIKKMGGKIDFKNTLIGNLHIYSLPANTYPYSFVLINRPKTVFPDHGSLYFIKCEDKGQYIYEVLLDQEQDLVADLKDVLRLFRDNLPSINVLDYVIE